MTKEKDVTSARQTVLGKDAPAGAGAEAGASSPARLLGFASEAVAVDDAALAVLQRPKTPLGAWLTYGVRFAAEIALDEALNLLADDGKLRQNGAQAATRRAEASAVPETVRTAFLGSTDPADRVWTLGGSVSPTVAKHLLLAERNPEVLRALLRDEKRVRALLADAKAAGKLFGLLWDEDVTETLSATLMSMKNRRKEAEDEIEPPDAFQKLLVEAEVRARQLDQQLDLEDRRTYLVLGQYVESPCDVPFVYLRAHMERTVRGDDAAASAADITSGDGILWARERSSPVPFGLGFRPVVLPIRAEAAAALLCRHGAEVVGFAELLACRKALPRGKRNMSALLKTARLKVREEELLPALATDPRVGVRLACVESLRGAVRAEAALGRTLFDDRSASVRAAVLRKGLVPDDVPDAWFRRLRVCGSRAEKLAAVDQIFRRPALAEEITSWIHDGDPAVGQTYAERTRLVLGGALEALKAMDAAGVKEGDSTAFEALEVLDLGTLSPDAATAVRLKRAGVSWLDAERSIEELRRCGL